jgi:hypothetical protein
MVEINLSYLSLKIQVELVVGTVSASAKLEVSSSTDQDAFVKLILLSGSIKVNRNGVLVII